MIIGGKSALRALWQMWLEFATTEGFVIFVQQSSSSTAASLSWPLTEMGEDFLSCGHVASIVFLACNPWMAHIPTCAPPAAGHFWHIASGRMVGFRPAHTAWIRLHLRHTDMSEDPAVKLPRGNSWNFSISSILSNWSKRNTGLWVSESCAGFTAYVWSPQYESSRALGAVSMRKHLDVCHFCFGAFMMFIN